MTTTLKALACASLIALGGALPASAQTIWGGMPYNFEPEIPNFPGAPSIPTIPPVVIPVPGVSPSTPDAGETQLTFGIPGKAPGSRIQGIDISTAQIDAVLRNVPAVNLELTTVTADFGNHYTRDLLNRGFEEIRELERGLELYAGEELADSVKEIVKVYSLDFDVSPFNLRLRQDGPDLTATLGDVSAKIVAKAKAPVCGTIKVRGYVENFSATASYDLVRGREIDIGVKAEKIKLKDSTGNPLKWFCAGIGKALGGNKIVANMLLDGTGLTVDGYRVNRLGNLPFSYDNTLVGRLDRDFNISDRRFYGANDLLAVTRHVLERPGTLPIGVAENARQDALMAVGQAFDFINDDNFQGSGLQVDFLFDDSRNNRVSLVVSHNPTDMRYIEYTKQRMLLQVDRGANTRNLFVYAKYPGRSNWTLLASGSNPTVLNNAPKGTQITVVGESRLIKGLYSKPGRILTVNNPFVGCGNNCPNLY